MKIIIIQQKHIDARLLSFSFFEKRLEKAKRVMPKALNRGCIRQIEEIRRSQIVFPEM